MDILWITRTGEHTRMGPPYDGKALANLLLDWAEADAQPITPLKLQKLLFFMHADYLTTTHRPLLIDEFEAWSYGPVIPAVYQEFKAFAGAAITARAFRFDPIGRTRSQAVANVEEDDLDQLRRLYSIYIGVSAGVLSQRSHAPSGAWAKALELFQSGGSINRRISNDLIRQVHRSEA